MSRRAAPNVNSPEARSAQGSPVISTRSPENAVHRRVQRRRTSVKAGVRGFTLIEVLVALGIVGIALVAGLQATMALTNHAQRQSDVLLAQLCAENELVRVRLSRQMPPIGDADFACEQAGRSFTGRRTVAATPNPNFRRVDAQVLDNGFLVLRVATIVGSLQ